MTEQPIIILGTGLAGYTLAREFRKLDKETPLLLITGDDGRNYSKPMLSHGISQNKTEDDLAMADAGKMAEQLNAIIRVNSLVTAIDAEQKVVYLGDESVPYSRLVLAMGASPIQPPLEGDGLDRVYSVNCLEDFARFRQGMVNVKKVLVIGAGLIGSEFANDLMEADYQVSVVSMGEQMLQGLVPKQVGDALQQKLESQGVEITIGPWVTRVDRRGEGVVATLNTGDQIEADIVLSAVGVRPKIDLATAAGLETGRGITVDRYLKASKPDIFALGDCAEVEGHVLLYVMPLMNSARALAKTLNGDDTPVSYPAMPVVIKTPSYPIVVQPPKSGQSGEWVFEQTDQGLRGLFSQGDQLLGFVLTGELVKERMSLAKQVPGLL
jgi:rubredoxin-NAD+ reductase